MVWVAIITGVVLLYIFPKQIGVVISVIVLGIGATYLYLKAEEGKRKKQQDSVVVSVSYDEKSCSLESPLLVTIQNVSSKTVSKVSWNIGAYRPGYSSNVVDYGYSGNYNTPYSSDKILAPGNGNRICYEVPSLSDGLDPKQLNWSALRKSINFIDR